MIILGVSIVVTGGLLVSGYIKSPPDQATIISGMGKARILVGKAGIRIPFFERVDTLPLTLIPLDIKTDDSVPTAERINVTVDSVANIKIGHAPEMIDIAKGNFLNKSPHEIGEIVSEVLKGNIREIVCTMKLTELMGERKAFADKVADNVKPDLAKMGIELVSFTIQGFTDKEGVIEDLGIENTAQLKKTASIAAAEAEKEITIARAKALEEENLAKVQADTLIAERENELESKKLKLQEDLDKTRAIADSSYKITEEEQRKQIEIETANANLAKQEKELELKEREVKIQEQILDAEIRKKAEAQRYAAEQESEADLFRRQKEAEAEKFEVEQEAAAKKAKAEADRYEAEQRAKAVEAEGKAQAEATRQNGLAEAESIKAKALAEAEGILKKAEAMKEYGEAAKREMELKTVTELASVLPGIAQAIGEGYANVGEIKLYGGDTAQLSGSITKTMTQVIDGVQDATGVNLGSVVSGVIGGKIASKNNKTNVEQETEASRVSSDESNTVVVPNGISQDMVDSFLKS